MNSSIISQLKDSWFTKQNELMQKRRPRRYLHFDTPIPSLTKKIWSRITNPTLIKTHSFFPLIKVAKSSRIYRTNPETKLKTIEWKERPISYASHYDALIYSWYTHQLEFYYEKRLKTAGLDECVIAYRKLGKSNIDFASEVFEFIKNNPDYSSLALDIKGFYDTLNFGLVKKAWKENLYVKDLPQDHYAIFKSVTKYAYVRLREINKALKVGTKSYFKSTLFLNLKTLDLLRENNKIKKNKLKGIPQGTTISCVLSNLYMFDFDKAMFQKIKEYGGIYRRYSDDILILCPKEYISVIEKFALDNIDTLKLVIQKSKTEIRHFSPSPTGIVCVNEEGKLSKIQYLGLTFDGKIINLRHKGYARFERKMHGAIVKNLIKSKENKTPFFKKKIYERYSPLGEHNYVSYAKTAGDKLSSDVIRKQVEHHRIMKKISKKLNKEKKRKDN